MADISIIIPLYNAETFLEETLKSIRNQTFQNYELICINDASDDGTVSIVKKMMKQDNRIKLIHNEKRSGAAYSRNKGIGIAQGRYAVFLDGDDIFDEKMLEKEYFLAEKYNLDIAMCEYVSVPSAQIHIKKLIERDTDYKKKFCSKYFNILEVEAGDCFRLSNVPWNKLYRMNFVKRNRLEFQSLACANDVYFVVMAYILADRMMFLDDKHVMVYQREHDMPSRISFNRDPMCTYEAYKAILMEVKERNVLDRSYLFLYARIYFNLIYTLRPIKDESRKREFYDFLKNTGIDELKTLGGEYFLRLPQEHKENLEMFQLLEYETRWFEADGIEHRFWRAFSKISSLWEENRKVVVWGAGRYGTRFIQFLNRNGLRINALIDADEKKAGLKLEGYQISRCQEVAFDKECTVIVAAKGAYESICEQLSNTDARIVDLMLLIGL